VAAVAFSIARSRFTLPAQFIFLLANAFALLLGVIYTHKTPNLYENNSHGKIGWVITWIASAWVFMALVEAYASRKSAHALQSGETLSSASMAQYQRVQEAELPSPTRWSNDSGQGTERNSASLCGHSRSPSVESEVQQFSGPTRRYTQEDDDLLDEDEKHGFLRNKSVDSFLSRTVGRFVVGRPLKIMRISYVVIERVLLVLGFLAITTGTVVYGGIGVS